MKINVSPPRGTFNSLHLSLGGMNTFHSSQVESRMTCSSPWGDINWTGSQTTQLQVAVAFLQNSRSRGEAARSDFSASLKKSWECRSTCGPKAHT